MDRTNWVRKGRAAAVVVAMLLVAANVCAQQTKRPFLAGHDIGVIFNTDDLLLDFESYQGGMGLKIADDKNAYRLLVDAFYSTASESIALTLGAAYERHFVQGRISPYVGGHLTAGYASTTTEASPDVWSKTTSFPMAIGGVFGVEVFLVRFLSLFAEYNLSVSLDYVETEDSNLGVTSSESTFDWTLDIGSGNQSKIGIVFYFQMDRKLDLQRVGVTK